MTSTKRRCITFLRFALSALALSLIATPRGYAQSAKRVDVEAVQGVLAVRALDGWLLSEGKGRNAIAVELVRPEGPTSKQWFYFIPAFGQPVILVHISEASAFEKVPGKKIEYAGYRDLKEGLRNLLKGASTIAMEYAPESGIASLTRVDAGTIALVKRAGLTIQSSADLVQFTKSLWGPDGRLSHYVAVHHLSKLREEALAFIAERITGDRPVTEQDVQTFLQNGYRIRGLIGSTSVATGVNTSKANYQPSARSSAAIKKDQLLILRLSGAVADSNRPIFASISWVAYVGETVPERYHRIFAVVAAARDATIDFIRNGVKKRRLVKGFEADQTARAEVGKAGMASRFVHATGHSLDTSLAGDGANLDDYETHDTRSLVVGSGFTVGPGIYIPGDFGIQSEVDVHIVQDEVEVTTPVQTRITPILLK